MPGSQIILGRFHPLFLFFELSYLKRGTMQPFREENFQSRFSLPHSQLLLGWRYAVTQRHYLATLLLSRAFIPLLVHEPEHGREGVEWSASKLDEILLQHHEHVRAKGDNDVPLLSIYQKTLTFPVVHFLD